MLETRPIFAPSICVRSSTSVSCLWKLSYWHPAWRGWRAATLRFGISSAEEHENWVQSFKSSTIYQNPHIRRKLRPPQKRRAFLSTITALRDIQRHGGEGRSRGRDLSKVISRADTKFRPVENYICIWYKTDTKNFENSAIASLSQTVELRNQWLFFPCTLMELLSALLHFYTAWLHVISLSVKGGYTESLS